MNYWVAMLAELPATGQRLIARIQRISLPHGCDQAAQLPRLRHALCREPSVRATYAALDTETQAALQILRTIRGGMRADDLERRFGAVRPWRALAADPRPRSIAERLVLLGWLLPRPAAPRHPPRYLLPPELRRMLPRPLQLQTLGPAPQPEPPPVLHAVTAILLACWPAPSVRSRCAQMESRGLTPLAGLSTASLRSIPQMPPPLPSSYSRCCPISAL